MARATMASASAQSDSIKGLAQSIAKPAYRRLLTAEPLLRRAVPVLILAFLITICVGAAVQVLDQRRQAIANDAILIAAAADLTAAELQVAPRDAKPHDVLARALPAWAGASSRQYLLTTGEGAIVAATDGASSTISTRRLVARFSRVSFGTSGRYSP